MRFLDRREFLKFGSAAALGGSALPMAAAAPPSAPSPGAQATADYTIRIATGLIELSPEHIVSTTLYNSQFPGRCCASRKVSGSSGGCPIVAEAAHAGS
jgi:hypothetical protein